MSQPGYLPSQRKGLKPSIKHDEALQSLCVEHGSLVCAPGEKRGFLPHCFLWGGRRCLSEELVRETRHQWLPRVWCVTSHPFCYKLPWSHLNSLLFLSFVPATGMTSEALSHEQMRLRLHHVSPNSVPSGLLKPSFRRPLAHTLKVSFSMSSSASQKRRELFIGFISLYFMLSVVSFSACLSFSSMQFHLLLGCLHSHHVC